MYLTSQIKLHQIIIKNIRVAPKNSTMDSVIGIDVGTGSVRGCAFDLDGNQISEPEGNSQIILK